MHTFMNNLKHKHANYVLEYLNNPNNRAIKNEEEDDCDQHINIPI